jgi:hypothetical protein
MEQGHDSGHSMPHAPQCELLLPIITQLPSQQVWPGMQAASQLPHCSSLSTSLQLPAQHSWFSPQVVLQPPQCAGVSIRVHTLLQQSSFASQAMLQPPQ